MEQYKLSIGGVSIDLKKSDSMIGLKPFKGQEQLVEGATRKLGCLPNSQALSGFQVAQFEQSEVELENTLSVLRNEASVSIGTHIYHTSEDGVPFVPTGELYIQFKEKATDSKRQNILDQYALEIIEAKDDELTAMVTKESPNPVKVAMDLQKLKEIDVAEPDLSSPGQLTSFVLPSDNLLSDQWHLENTGKINGSSLGLKKGADARVIDAWSEAQSLGSPSITVAVIDDGFDLKHPDLGGSGKVIAPWDFTRGNSNPIPEFNLNYPYYNPRYRQWEGDWHGTACAGVAVGKANATGIVGAAPNSRLMPVRWGINLSDSQVESWFNYVRLQGADVVSCSWGAMAKVFPLSTRKKRAISQCATQGRSGKGCVICFAAGNDNQDINNPNTYLNGFGIHPDVIAVAACNSRDEKSHYSNFGKEISVTAPSSGAGGRGILTSDVMGTFVRNGRQIESGYSPGAFTSNFGGTSSSTPLVAGICALLLSINPNLKAGEVKKIIEKTARKIGSRSSYDAKGHSPYFGYGCIDALEAVKALCQ